MNVFHSQIALLQMAATQLVALIANRSPSQMIWPITATQTSSDSELCQTEGNRIAELRPVLLTLRRERSVSHFREGKCKLILSSALVYAFYF